MLGSGRGGGGGSSGRPPVKQARGERGMRRCGNGEGDEEKDACGRRVACLEPFSFEGPDWPAFPQGGGYSVTGAQGARDG